MAFCGTVSAQYFRSSPFNFTKMLAFIGPAAFRPPLAKPSADPLAALQIRKDSEAEEPLRHFEILDGPVEESSSDAGQAQCIDGPECAPQTRSCYGCKSGKTRATEFECLWRCWKRDSIAPQPFKLAIGVVLFACQSFSISTAAGLINGRTSWSFPSII